MEKDCPFYLVLKALKKIINTIKKTQQQSFFPEIITQLLKIIHRHCYKQVETCRKHFLCATLYHCACTQRRQACACAREGCKHQWCPLGWLVACLVGWKIRDILNQTVAADCRKEVSLRKCTRMLVVGAQTQSKLIDSDSQVMNFKCDDSDHINNVCRLLVTGSWVLEIDIAVDVFLGTLNSLSEVPSCTIILERRQNSLQLIHSKLSKTCQKHRN